MGEKKNAHVKKVVIVSEELSNVLDVWFDPGRKAPSAESAGAAVTLLLTPKWYSHVGFKPVCAIVRRTGEPLIKTETFISNVQRLLNISAAMPLSRNHGAFPIQVDDPQSLWAAAWKM